MTEQRRIHELWEVYVANVLGARVPTEAERRAFHFGAWAAMRWMRDREKEFMEDVELSVEFSMGLFDPESDE